MEKSVVDLVSDFVDSIGINYQRQKRNFPYQSLFATPDLQQKLKSYGIHVIQEAEQGSNI